MVTLDKKINDQLQRQISKYNYENFHNLIHTTIEGHDEEIDTAKITEMKLAVDHYFDLYGSDNDEFKEFIKIISIYLTFIEKKPLHPPGILFSGGKTVYKNAEAYYCTAKKYFMKEDHSLCKYCVCHTA